MNGEVGNIIFSVTVEELQEYAIDTLGRQLHTDEIRELKNIIDSNTKGFDNWIKEVISTSYS